MVSRFPSLLSNEFLGSALSIRTISGLAQKSQSERKESGKEERAERGEVMIPSESDTLIGLGIR